MKSTLCENISDVLHIIRNNAFNKQQASNISVRPLTFALQHVRGN